MSRPIVVTSCMAPSSKSWSPQRRPPQWHLRAGGGAVHSIKSGIEETVTTVIGAAITVTRTRKGGACRVFLYGGVCEQDRVRPHCVITGPRARPATAGVVSPTTQPRFGGAFL